MIAVAVVDNENPEIREEDYAAAMMAMQNIMLAAVELGLGTHIKTGAVMGDPAARAAVGVCRRTSESSPSSTSACPPRSRRRRSAKTLAALTTWVP